MDYRRKQEEPSSKDNSTVGEQLAYDYEVGEGNSPSSSPSSLAAKAIRASSAYRDSSLSSAYSSPDVSRLSTSSPSPTTKDPKVREYTSKKNLGESRQGFWGVLASKAKAILDDDNPNRYEAHRRRQSMPATTSGSKLREDKPIVDGDSRNQQSEFPVRTRQMMTSTASGAKDRNTEHSQESRRKIESPKIQKGINAITSSLNYIGGTIGNAVEEGITIVENRTAGIIEETRKHIKKKPSSSLSPNQAAKQPSMSNQVLPRTQNDLDIQLKASRDVAMAMAAKAKLLLRELKTVKADLAFGKQRCAQLEEENKSLRESRDRGDNPEDDDLVRLQLETLLAEKARLSHENSIYARENRFLREVVEYHQLTMQDVVYFDEGTEEVTEVGPIKVPPPVSNPHLVSGTSSLPVSPSIPPGASVDSNLQVTPNPAHHFSQTAPPHDVSSRP